MAFPKTAVFFIFLILKSSTSLPIPINSQPQITLVNAIIEGSKPSPDDSTVNVNSTSGAEFSVFKLNSSEAFNESIPTAAGKSIWNPYTITGAVLGGLALTVVVVSLPALLGFLPAGIAASSAGAAMMSSAAIANGGYVVAGSSVALLQSVGVLGVTSSTLGIATTATAAAAGAGLGFGLGHLTEKIVPPVSSLFNTISNWTVTNAAPVASQIKIGTVDAWNTVANWTVENSKLIANQIINGTVDSWNTVANWTVENSEHIEKGSVDAWKTVANWTVENSKHIKKGSVDAWSTVANWTVENSKHIKKGSVDAWKTVANWTAENSDSVSKQIKYGTLNAWNSVMSGQVKLKCTKYSFIIFLISLSNLKSRC